MTQSKSYDPYYAGPAVYNVDPLPVIDTFKPAPHPVIIEAKTNEPELIEQAAEPVEDPISDVIEVPEGSAAKILEWVGEDRERASAALEAEKSGQGRKTLVAKLEGLLEG
jgi:hypothetical protein